MKWVWGVLVVLGLSGCVTDFGLGEFPEERSLAFKVLYGGSPERFQRAIDFVPGVKGRANQLKPGMTEKEIVAILGEMEDVGPKRGAVVSHGSWGERYTWRYILVDRITGSLTSPVELQMENGRLVSWVIQ